MSKAKDVSKEEAKALPEAQSKDAAAGELKDAQLDAVAGGLVGHNGIMQDGLANPLGLAGGPSPHMRGAGPHVGGYDLKVGSKVEGKH